MPRIPRTPQRSADKQQDGQQQQQSGKPENSLGADLERFLAGSENRLALKIDSTNKAVNESVTLAKLTNDSLEVLKEKVDVNEVALRPDLEETEERIMERFQNTVKETVNDQ